MTTEFRRYSCRKYQHGWMVVSVGEDGGDERMEMCYVHEIHAVSHAMRLNMDEPRRVAEAVERENEAKKRLHVPNSPYYSITGYYGD